MAHELNPAVAQTDRETDEQDRGIRARIVLCDRGVRRRRRPAFGDLLRGHGFHRSQGGDITRYNLASEPQAFADNEAAKAFLHLSGSAGLPLVLVDGVTAMTGRYPDRSQLATWAGLAQAAVPAGGGLGITATGSEGGCCGSAASSCC